MVFYLLLYVLFLLPYVNCVLILGVPKEDSMYQIFPPYGFLDI